MKASDTGPVVVLVAALSVVIGLPSWYWISSWRDCRKVGGALVKDGCDMPACVERKQ